MQKIDNDGRPDTEPQVVVTPKEARGGVISGRVVLVLGASLILAVLVMSMLGVFS